MQLKQHRLEKDSKHDTASGAVLPAHAPECTPRATRSFLVSHFASFPIRRCLQVSRRLARRTAHRRNGAVCKFFPSLIRLGSKGFLFLLVVGGMASITRADEASGTWTGEVYSRGNYYLERSTRVMAPTFGLQTTSPDGVQLGAEYLVDAITSASVGAGAITDIAFTEVRHDATLMVGKEWDWEKIQLTSTVSAHLSNEPDYQSYGAVWSNAISWNQRNTTLSTRVGFSHDIVGRVLRGADNAGNQTSTSIGNLGNLNALVAGVSASQNLSPTINVEAGYDVGNLEGFLANPYRQVMVAGTLRSEAHPEKRLRHTVYARIKNYIPKTNTAIHLSHRAYLDSWDIGAINPEIRVYQELTDYLRARLRYRFYKQRRAYFSQNPENYVSTSAFVTADPKMTGFTTHLIGGKITAELTVLENTPFSLLSNASVDLVIEHLWNSNRFGNGVIAQLGFTTPF